MGWLSFRFYQNAYKKWPLLTHACETGVIMAGSDTMSQIFVERKKLECVDISRSLRFAAIGVCFVAPTRVAWYKLLEQQLPGHSMKTVIQKVVVDQGCFAPCMVCFLILSVSVANGMNKEEVILKLRASYKEIILNNWKVWPMVQICNFYLVPSHLRMSFVQLIALLWNIYLSWKTNTDN